MKHTCPFLEFPGDPQQEPPVFGGHGDVTAPILSIEPLSIRSSHLDDLRSVPLASCIGILLLSEQDDAIVSIGKAIEEKRGLPR